MLKKLLVLLISFLALIGCQERQKITAEMLVGTWRCEVDNSRGTKYDFDGSKLRTMQPYTLNNADYVVLIGKEEERLLVQSKYYQLIVPISPDNNYTKFKGALECKSKYQINNIITEMEYKFISEDELKESSFTKYERCDIQKSIMEFNIEATCKRVH